jgi:hypothetical protein
LAFLEHVHERNPGEGLLGGVDGLDPQHGTGDALHAAMILFHEIIQLLHPTDGDGGPVRRMIALDGGVIGLTAVNGDLLRHAAPAARVLEKPYAMLVKRFRSRC